MRSAPPPPDRMNESEIDQRKVLISAEQSSI